MGSVRQRPSLQRHKLRHAACSMQQLLAPMVLLVLLASSMPAATGYTVHVGSRARMQLAEVSTFDHLNTQTLYRHRGVQLPRRAAC